MENTSCCQGFRCNNHRKCETCALVRMYRFANEIKEQVPKDSIVTFGVITPDNQQELAIARKKFNRWAGKHTYGHVWTVETGKTAHGLHLNLLIANHSEIEKAEIEKVIGICADVWAKKIEHIDIEKTLKYISKPKGIPSKETYPGRLTGRSGDMLNPISYLARKAGGIANLVAQETRLNEAEIIAEEIQDKKTMLDHLPTITHVINNAEKYKQFCVDNQGYIVNNPDHIPNKEQ